MRTQSVISQSNKKGNQHPRQRRSHQLPLTLKKQVAAFFKITRFKKLRPHHYRQFADYRQGRI